MMMPLLGAWAPILQGFRASPSQILLIAAGVIVPVSVLVAFTIRRTRRLGAESRKRNEALYQGELLKHQFEPAELALVECLVEYLPHQAGKHDLLTSAAVFQAAVERADEYEELPEEEISALRVKLAFGSQDPERSIHSSAELSEELSLIIIQKKVRKLRATLTSIEPTSLGIRVEDNEIPPAAGTEIQVYFKRQSGIFTFTSRVISLDGANAAIAHSENVNRYQKRTYYRRKISIPVLVTLAGSEEKPARYSFVDLGGGGASITNPDLRFRPGDDIEIKFAPSSEERIELIGEIIRLSDAGHVMHMAFGPIREAMRDRIIGFILNAGNKD